MEALRRSIYREHLDEVSFFYEHRLMALEDPDFTLPEIAQLEGRCEAHLDGLVLGGEEARRLCKVRAGAGDFGELHGALRIFCRTDSPEELVEVVAEADASDAQYVAAVADALKYELPASWTDKVKTWLTAEDCPALLQASLAVAAGYRGVSVVPELLARVRSAKGPEVLPYLHALGQLRDPKAGMLFFRFMQQPEHDVGRAAAIAALRLQGPDSNVRSHLHEAMSAFTWAPIPLALAADAYAAGPLLGLAHDNPSPDGLLALGLLGDVSVLSSLLGFLSDAKLAESAALALYLVTGADLPEVVEAPRERAEFEPDDSVDDEKEQQEEEPLLVTRLISQSPEQWKAWLSQHSGRFSKGKRYRLGEVYSPGGLVRGLTQHRLPLTVRRLLVDEIAIRYRVNARYAPDMPAKEQLSAISSIGPTLVSVASHLRDLCWDVAIKDMTSGKEARECP